MTRGIIPRAPQQRDTRTRRALAQLANIPLATEVPVVVALDTFTSGSVVALNTHTMDVGQGWFQEQSASTVAQVQNGTNLCKFDQNGAGGSMVWRYVTSLSAGTYYMGVNIPSGHEAFLGIAMRVAAGGNDFVFVGIGSGGVFGGAGQFRIMERVSGTYFTRSSQSMTVAFDSNYAIVAVLTGTTISATITGPNASSTPISYNSLSVNTPGVNHGIAGAGLTVSDFIYAVGPYKMTTP